MSDSNLNELLAELPAKQRVHELAKRAGLSSKAVLAALAVAGFAAKSSQSSVDAHYAAIALNALLGDGSATASGPAAPADEPAPAAPADEPAPAAPGPAVSGPAASDPSDYSDPAAQAPSKPKRIRNSRGNVANAKASANKTASDSASSEAALSALASPFTPPAFTPPSFAAPAVTALPDKAPATTALPDTASPIAASNTALDAALADLPARSRVHELAKRAGISAKAMIAALAEQDVAVKSAHSVIAHDQAVAALTSILSNAAPDGFDLGTGFAAPVLTPEFNAPDVSVGPVFISPEETARPPRRRRGRGANDQTAPKTEADAEPNLLDLDGILDAAVGPVAGPAEPTTQTDATAASDEDDNSDESRRRRRRGRRGRGRSYDKDTEDRQDHAEGAGDQPPGEVSASSDVEAPATPAAEVTDSDDDGTEDEDGGTGSSSRRRRRRRSRGNSGEDGSGVADDPIDTVVHVREPKSVESQVQGVRGSTRLEAKRQRRRDSRDTRRRPQILTEAEFLARRESVERVMTVRQRGDLAQVALLEDGVLVEHFVSRAGSASMIGNVYLGRVQNVLPSMEAAFVDIGRGRNAVLYAGEVNWDAAGLAGKSRKIETALSSGDTLLVQVSKDPVGHKGSRLTTQISLPGRFLVYVPNGGATGISRKLPDTERRRLKAILDRIVPDDAGVIIRTAAEGVSEEELARDVERLQAQWAEISKRASQKSNAPEQLYSEPDTLIKVIRDLFNSDITKLIIDGDDAYESLSSYVQQVAPELADRVSKFEGRTDVFAAHRIDEQIAKALERKVHLPSGGSLVIDRTEAMTVVDVNTGKYTGSGGNLEETVTKNNLEAAEEVVRQLRLRDIGGIIVVDFIDMVLESNRDLVLRRLTECLGRDRTRHQVAEVTSLGLIQMTRKKMGTGLVEAFSEPCEHCHGRGIVLHDVPVDMGVPEFAVQPTGGDRNATGDRRRRGRDSNREAAREAPAVEVDAITASMPQVTPPQRDPRGPKPPSFAEKQAAREAEQKLAAATSTDAALTAQALGGEVSADDSVDPVAELVFGGELIGEAAVADSADPASMGDDALDSSAAIEPNWDAAATAGRATTKAAPTASDTAVSGTAEKDETVETVDSSEAVGTVDSSEAGETAEGEDSQSGPAGRSGRRRGGRGRKKAQLDAAKNGRSAAESDDEADSRSRGDAKDENITAAAAATQTAGKQEPIVVNQAAPDESAKLPAAVIITSDGAAAAPAAAPPRRRRAASRPAGPPQR